MVLGENHSEALLSMVGNRPYVPRRLHRKTSPGPSHWGSGGKQSMPDESDVIDAKIGDLPAYRDRILLAIQSNPGSKAVALVAFLEKTYSVRVHFQALRKYIERENLFEAATTAPCTPIRSTGAPATPIGAPMQASPARPMRSPGKKIHAKIADLPRYKHRIVAAIKANPGKRHKALSSALERDYALVVHWNALWKYCDEHNLWSMNPDAPTPSRVLAGKRKLGEAIGRKQDDCWSYTTEIAAILKESPSAGGWAVAAKLKSIYFITISAGTLDRWLKKHREALLDGTLERPMVEEDGLPEDYADQIKAILKDEPKAERKRVHALLKSRYQVFISEKRLLTYLASLDRSTMASPANTAIDPSRRRTPKKDAEDGYEWLLWNEDRVIALLKTLGVVGDKLLQQTIETVCKVTVARQPLRTFLEKHYAKGGRLYGHRVHKEAAVALTDDTYEDEISSVKPIYVDLRQKFSESDLSMDTLIAILYEDFGITLSVGVAQQLLVRIYWDIESRKHFQMAI